MGRGALTTGRSQINTAHRDQPGQQEREPFSMVGNTKPDLQQCCEVCAGSPGAGLECLPFSEGPPAPDSEAENHPIELHLAPSRSGLSSLFSCCHSEENFTGKYERNK